MEIYRKQLDRNITYSLKGLLQNIPKGKEIICLPQRLQQPGMDELIV